MVERELEDQERRLIEVALEGMKSAHIIWGFAVGAAVLAGDDRLYQGCNVESLIAGIGVCAERCAIDHAVLHGNKRIKKVAVVMDDKNAMKPRPCGACLQYILDFSKGEAEIIMAKVKDKEISPKSIEIKTIKEMLPHPYEIEEKGN